MLEAPRSTPVAHPPAQGIVTLLDAITSKLILDRLVGIKAGHRELLDILHRVRDHLAEPLESKAVR